MCNTRFALLVLFATVPFANLAVAGNPQQRTGSAECALTAEDHSVYTAMFMDRGRPEDPEERWDDKPVLVISDETDAYERSNPDNALWGFKSNSRQAPNKETADNYKSKMRMPCRLGGQLLAGIPYSSFSKEDQKRIFKKGVTGWDEFYKRYKNSSGYWTVSLIGYNSTATEAVVYLGHHCGILCGTGHYVLLAKENGKWVVRNRVMLWIS